MGNHTPPSEDIDAGDAFRQSVLPKADASKGSAPLWYGWVIMDAFLAGAAHARKTPAVNANGALVTALRGLVNAKALAGVRAQVAGWNGEGKPDGPYERHPASLGAIIPKTNCGAVYELDEAMQAAREVLALAEKGGA